MPVENQNNLAQDVLFRRGAATDAKEDKHMNKLAISPEIGPNRGRPRRLRPSLPATAVAKAGATEAELNKMIKLQTVAEERAAKLARAAYDADCEETWSEMRRQECEVEIPKAAEKLHYATQLSQDLAVEYQQKLANAPRLKEIKRRTAVEAKIADIQAKIAMGRTCMAQLAVMLEKAEAELL